MGTITILSHDRGVLSIAVYFGIKLILCDVWTFEIDNLLHP